MVQFLLKLLLKQNSCCSPRFPLIVSCYKIVDNQIAFKLCEESESDILEARSCSQTFYIRFCNLVLML